MNRYISKDAPRLTIKEWLVLAYLITIFLSLGFMESLTDLIYNLFH